MAKAKKKIRRRKKFTLPLAIMGPVAGEAIKVGGSLAAGDTRKAAEYLIADYTGYNINSNDFKIERLKSGLLPLLLGTIIHKGANALGVNRALASARVPYIRI